MRRTVLLAVVLLAGCGESAPEVVLPARSAEPQRVELGWRESYPPRGERLLFAVDALEIREDGWAIEVAVTNRTKVAFELGGTPADLGYGVMLFGTGELKALEEAARAGDLPAIRRAEVIEPEPPARLEPGETWRAILSAPGSLVDGSWLRVTFGPLVADGVAPKGMEAVVFWITDRARRL